MDHFKFQAAHQQRLAELASKRDERVAQGEAIVASAKDDHHAESKKAEREHAEAQQSRHVEFQRWAAEIYDPIVRDYYTADPSRANVAKLADALIAVEAAAWQQCGLNLDRNNSGPGKELMHALIAQKIEATPEAASRLASLTNGAIGNADAHYNQAVAALRARDIVGAQNHLAAVESAIGLIARQGSTTAGDGLERFKIVRFGGLPGRRAAALAEFDRADFDRRNGTQADRAMRSAAMEQATTRRNDGESVGDAFRRILGELQGRAKQAIAEVIAPEAPPQRRKPSRLDEMRASSDEPLTITI